MENFKRILAIVCMMALVLSMNTVVFAATENTDNQNVEQSAESVMRANSLVQAVGVSGGLGASSIDFTASANCVKFRVLGRANDGSTNHNVSVNIAVVGGNNKAYVASIPIDGSYHGYYRVNLTAGVKYIVEVTATESFYYTAGIYFYN